MRPWSGMQTSGTPVPSCVLGRGRPRCGSDAGRTSQSAGPGRGARPRLAQSGIGVVYGGGGLGLMGAVARGALDAGGEVIGVIPESLLRLEPPPGFLTELRIVRSMHERKAMMVELRRCLRRAARRAGNSGRDFGGIDMGTARTPQQAVRTAQSRELLRSADGMAGPCDGAAIHPGGASGDGHHRQRARPPARSARPLCSAESKPAHRSELGLSEDRDGGAPSGRRPRVCLRPGTSRTGMLDKIDSPIPVSDRWGGR